MSNNFGIIRIKKMSTSDFMFFVPYALYLMSGIFRLSMLGKYFTGYFNKVNLAVVLFALIYREIYNNKLTKKNLISCLLAIFCFLIANKFGSSEFAIMFIIIWAARNIKFERIAKCTIYISTVLLLFIILSSLMGIIDDYVAIQGNRTRHYLGFRYALYPSAILYNIFSLYIYLKKEEIHFFEILFLMLINYIVYVYTNSRLSFGLSTLLFCVALVLKYFPNILNKKNILCKIMVFSFILCSIISLYFSINYDSSISWMNELNVILGKRFSLAYNSVKTYGFSLLGQTINWYGNGLGFDNEIAKTVLKGGYNYVDSAYILLFQKYGIVFTIIILAVLTITMFRCYKKKDYYLLSLMTFIALHAFIDDLVIYLFYNTLLFVVSTDLKTE